MKSLTVGVLIGLVAGLSGGYAVSYLSGNSASTVNRIVRDIATAKPMESAEVVEHRNNQFSELHTIESLQSLPGDFVKIEALYALCSRSSTEELVDLAVDAARIMDLHWRGMAFDVIFQRLAEMEPAMALDLSRSDLFLNTRSAQAAVLQTWARFDLMAAVTAVSQIDDNTQSLAAQMIYSGIGGAYTSDALTVEQALGIGPSRSNRDRFVRDMFDISPDAALDHVMALDSKAHQHEQIQTIAKLLAFEDTVQAELLGERIENDALRRRYLGVVYDRIGREQPVYAAKKRFALRRGGKVTDDEKKAFEQIAKVDLDSALVLFEQLTDDGNREALGLIIASQYVKDDTQQALQWARSASESVRKKLVNLVVVQMADLDPVLALQEAGSLVDEAERNRVTLLVVNELVSRSPKMAAEHIGHIEDEARRNRAAQTVARKWFSEDPLVAIDWVLNTDTAVQAAVFGDRRALDRVDLYDAQALVGSLPAEYRGTWARKVADRLVAEKTAEDAIRFVSQFSGQPDYDMQLAHVVSTIAKDDSELAGQWIDQLPTGHPRDGALSTIVLTMLRADPADAVKWLRKIDDADLRQDSAGSVARAWFQSDPAAARQWVDAMPRGVERDNVLTNAAASMYRQSDTQLEIIESIDDADKRQQAMFMRGMTNSRDDPEELIRQLELIEMPELFKQQIKAGLLRRSVSGR
jgi:hypothetical protein